MNALKAALFQLWYTSRKAATSRLGCAILNRMIHLGKPQSYRVGTKKQHSTRIHPEFMQQRRRKAEYNYSALRAGAYEGKGVGMGIIQRMMELNRGYFKYECFESSLFQSGNVPYCTSSFVLGFRSQPVH